MINPKTQLAKEDYQSGQKTAKKAAAILVSKNLGFIVPTARQKLNLLVAFAKKGKVVYGRAFDIVKLAGPVTLDDLSDVEKKLKSITIFEIKSTKKILKFRLLNLLLLLDWGGGPRRPEPQEAVQIRACQHDYDGTSRNGSGRNLRPSEGDLLRMEYNTLNCCLTSLPRRASPTSHHAKNIWQIKLDYS